MAKITVGFKCEPNMKNDLWQEATQSGITLSEHVENICANRWNILDGSSDDTEELDDLLAELEVVRSRQHEYEAMLAPLFQKFNGQTLDMKLPDGSFVNKSITRPIDVLEVVLSSVKH